MQLWLQFVAKARNVKTTVKLLSCRIREQDIILQQGDIIGDTRANVNITVNGQVRAQGVDL